MQRLDEFRLSELYLACRTLGARHWLTHTVLCEMVNETSPAFARAVMGAPVTYGDHPVIPFRRHPIDLRFVCALVGSTGKAASHGFVICSDEALGYMGALQIGTKDPVYSLHEKSPLPAILEEYDIFRALRALANPAIHQARLALCSASADALTIQLPDDLLTLTHANRTPETIDSFRFVLRPPTGRPEELQQLRLSIMDESTVRLDIPAQHLMMCHHAGLQAFPFELITPQFVLNGAFPDLLGSQQHYPVHHMPTGLFHGIFKGLDNQLIRLPDQTSQALRKRITWLATPEFAT